MKANFDTFRQFLEFQKKKLRTKLINLINSIESRFCAKEMKANFDTFRQFLEFQKKKLGTKFPTLF